MARGFSKAIITGNITRDPELRTTPSGSQVCSFSVAVNRNYKDSSGESKEDVSFIDCSAWGKAAEIISQYAKKGTGILVSGRLDQRSWEKERSGSPARWASTVRVLLSNITPCLAQRVKSPLVGIGVPTSSWISLKIF